MAEPKSESPITKKIFDLYTIEALKVEEVADRMGVCQQRVSQVINSDTYKDLEQHYLEAMDENLDVQSRLKRMRARLTFIDAVEGAADMTVLQSGKMDPAGQRAREYILKMGGVDIPDDVDESAKIFVINVGADTIESLADLGYRKPDKMEFHDKTHAYSEGEVIGKGVSKERERAEHTGSDPDTEADDSSD